jgi:uracil-DNA glycosylase family 4
MPTCIRFPTIRAVAEAFAPLLSVPALTRNGEQAGSWTMNRMRELQKIAAEIKQCRECRIGGTGKAVPGEGSPDAAVMFIGEAPGREEAKTGRPFVGRSGRFLRRMLAGIGIQENSVFITSPVHYLPVSGKPTTAMIEHGRTHLLKQINLVKPRLVVLLGNTACRTLLETNVEVSSKHGTVVERIGTHYFISFHPAYAMRFPEARRKFSRDLEALKALMPK